MAEIFVSPLPIDNGTILTGYTTHDMVLLDKDNNIFVYVITHSNPNLTIGGILQVNGLSSGNPSYTIIKQKVLPFYGTHPSLYRIDNTTFALVQTYSSNIYISTFDISTNDFVINDYITELSSGNLSSKHECAVVPAGPGFLLVALVLDYSTSISCYSLQRNGIGNEMTVQKVFSRSSVLATSTNRKINIFEDSTGNHYICFIESGSVKKIVRYNTNFFDLSDPPSPYPNIVIPVSYNNIAAMNVTDSNKWYFYDGSSWKTNYDAWTPGGNLHTAVPVDTLSFTYDSTAVTSA